MAYAAKVAGSDETRDAFIGFVDNLQIKGSANETVTLQRPFAQINVGLTKGQIKAAADAGFKLDKVTVKTKSHNNFNFATGVGNPDDELMAVEFEAASYLAPVSGQNAQGEDLHEITANGATYDWVSFNYVLPYTASAAQPTELVDVEIIFTDENGKTIEVPAFTNVPIERNHRTNIVGDLLTDPAKFEVVILPGFENDEHVVEAWDGKSIKKPAYNAAEKTYTIKDAAELAWIAQLVNGTLPAASRAGEVAKAESLDGQIVKLAKDIYLGGHEWTPIGLGSNHFRGTFDGQNHTIYGLHITKRGDTRAALFGTVSYTVAFRNLTISGASIECPDYNGDFYGAAMVGTMYGNVTFDNVKVVDSYISGNNKVGALVAHDGVCSSLNIQNCHVSGTTFEALNAEDGGSVGGLVGFFQGVAKGTNAAPYGDHHVANSSVKKCVFNVINSTNSGKRANAQLIGGISSKEGQELYIDQCVVENNTWNERFYADGVEVTTGTFVSPYGILIGGDRNDAPKGDVYIDGQKVVILTPIAEGIGMDSNGNYVITANEGLAWVAGNVADNNGFEGKTISLSLDVDLTSISFSPIGYNPADKTAAEFKGTFDGQGHTIKGINQQDLAGGYHQSVGLFAKIKDATIKNLTLENIVAAKYGAEAGAVASIATGDCAFEDIEVKSGSIVAYNNDASAILGWGNVGNFTFKNIKIGADVTVHSLWNSYDTSVGGVIGTLKSGSTATFENIVIDCKLDVYNDVCSNYQWGAYRRAGMLIGNMDETQVINGTNYPNPAAAGVTCKNVTVNYGDWMNYHYCEFKSNGHGSYDDEFTWKCSRVEGSDWGSNTIDTTQCNHESFESHNMCLPVDQLFGGGQSVYGLASYPGVTVNYPASYTPEN